MLGKNESMIVFTKSINSSKIINFLQIISRIVTKLSLHNLLFVIIVDQNIKGVMLRKKKPSSTL
jgi:hypothetical protein